MEKIDIPLKKQSDKFTMTLVAAALVGMLLATCIYNIFNEGFNLVTGFQVGVVLIIFIAVLMSISDYTKMKDGTLTIESDGVVMRFYISHKTGTANKSNSIRLENMKRFYVVNKKTMFIFTDKMFEFEPKTGITKKRIEVFPSILEIDEAGFNKVMAFVNRVAPQIELGYNGFNLVNMFKK